MKRVLLSLLMTTLLGVMFLISCGKEYSCENCATGNGNNQPPIANAGKDKIITLPTDSTTLDGSGSTDPDGTIRSFSWTKISGPASFAIANASAQRTIIKNLRAGVYQLELKVTDNGGLSAKDTVRITVDSVVTINHPPIANAGPDQIIVLPVTTVNLDGSASFDPDNNITGYVWTKITGPASFNIANANAMQTPAANLALGVYQFELKVTDAGGLFSKDTVKVTVRATPLLPPIANAGADITLNYNLQTCRMEPSTITLDGSSSMDPDGIIVSYQWSVVFAENSSVTITNPNAAIATVNNLFPGLYKFRLLVTDNDALIDDDTITVNTVYINRPEVNAQLIPVGTLSQTRNVSAVATVANKIFFAGGRFPPTVPGPNFSNVVDIYDITTGSWSTATLSQPRWGMTAATLGNKVFFAGGTAILPSAVGLTTRVDVYDATTNAWSTMEMPHSGGSLASIGLGNKLFIAGGNFADIYDDANGLWSSKMLSQSRYLLSATNGRGQLYFAGGVTNLSGGVPSSRIDIYDPASNSWSVSEMSKPKYKMASTTINGKLFWAGGVTSDGITNEVEMEDLIGPTGTTFSCLFQPNSFSYHSIGKSNNKMVFFVWDGRAKNRFDIYDIITNTWSIGVLDQDITPSLIISVNNTIYVAGGVGNSNGYYNQVWKLFF